MRVGSLFSGGGLGDYGLECAGMEIKFQVEIDDYCQKILNLRWPHVPKWKDIREVKGSDLPPVDIISGGFPCQPFSLAGKRKGELDNRNLWPEMFRIISEVKPAWVLAENVRGIVKPYLDKVLADLESLDYACLPLLIPASAIGAPHRRERLWIVAHAKHDGQLGPEKSEGVGTRVDAPTGTSGAEQSSGSSSGSGRLKNVADTDSRRRKQRDQKERSISIPSDLLAHSPDKGDVRRDRELPKNATPCESGIDIAGGTAADDSRKWWEAEPLVGRVVDGCPNRVDRLKLLGNGQVSQVVQWIGEQIMKYNEKNNERYLHSLRTLEGHKTESKNLRGM